MNREDLMNVAAGKYNQWCHKQPLVCADHSQNRAAASFLARQDLMPSERLAFYAHELTRCEGLEFVAFSNARLEGPTRLTHDVFLVPCFLNLDSGVDGSDPLLPATLRMERKCRFIYDGWVRISGWEKKTVRQAVQDIDRALSTFCVIAGITFKWAPKYVAAGHPSLAYKFGMEHLDGVERVSKALDTLNDTDRVAMYRSLGWLSQGICLNEPAARFLFAMLTIESLATYIEERAPADSPLAVLRTADTKAYDQADCIRQILAVWTSDNPVTLVQRAYFDCIKGTTRKLKDHVARVLDTDPESYSLLFEKKINGRALYDLRHYVAHGGVDALSEQQREHIRQRADHAEQIARKYVWTVLEKTLKVRPRSMTIPAGSTIRDDVFSRRGMHRGPTHVALIYD